jgi:16S rRNA G966 N2-methylase RsmD
VHIFLPLVCIVFLDPPYDAAEEYDATLRRIAALLAEGALVVAEHRRKDKLAVVCGKLSRTRLLEQGDAALSFYAVAQE